MTAPVSKDDAIEAALSREAELAILRRAFDTKRTKVVVVTGPPDIGKSALMTTGSAIARKEGWDIVPAVDAGQLGLQVVAGVSPDELCLRLADRMDFALLEESDTIDHRGREKPSALSESAAGSQKDAAGLAARAGNKAVEPPREGSVASSIRGAAAKLLGRATKGPLPSILLEVRRRAPIVLVVDDFRPDRALWEWFNATFVPALRAEEAAVLLLIGVRDDVPASKGLEALADEVVRIGPLSKDRLVKYFRDLGQGLSRPLTQSEIVSYADACRARPERVHILARLLRLPDVVAGHGGG